MSTTEILRIVIPSLGVLIIAAILIRFVRGQSARRERALTETAAKYGLKYTPGGKDFFQGSWPGKVDGVYRSRKLAFHYHNEPTMTPRGYSAADYSAIFEIAVKNPQQGSLSLEGRGRAGADAPDGGGSFDQNLAISSKPNNFAAGVLESPQLRQRLADVTLKSYCHINVVRTGTVAFTSNRAYRNSAELFEIIDALNDLADAVEAQPVRGS